MQTDNLTTKAVARLLRVSEATVKRWSDSGQLESEKTVGGHRRFSLQAIARLRREQGINPGTETPPRSSSRKRKPSPIAGSQSFAEALLHGDEKQSAALLTEAYLDGQTLISIFDTTVTEAMHRIGDLWFQGTITVADEHLATRVVLNALRELRAIVVPAEPTGMRAICCGIEGDLHELPCNLVTMILEMEGWEVKNLGPNTPLFAVRDMLARQRPHLLCVSARSLLDLDRATAEYAQLRTIAGKLETSVVIGGEGFRDKTVRQRFPSEYYAEDFSSFSKFARRLARKP